MLEQRGVECRGQWTMRIVGDVLHVDMVRGSSWWCFVCEVHVAQNGHVLRLSGGGHRRLLLPMPNTRVAHLLAQLIASASETVRKQGRVDAL